MTHEHKCGFGKGGFDPHAGCGHEWSHEEPGLFMPEGEYSRRHKCPNCGKGPWFFKFNMTPEKVVSGLILLLDELMGEDDSGKNHPRTSR